MLYIGCTNYTRFSTNIIYKSEEEMMKIVHDVLVFFLNNLSVSCKYIKFWCSLNSQWNITWLSNYPIKSNYK